MRRHDAAKLLAGIRRLFAARNRAARMQIHHDGALIKVMAAAGAGAAAAAAARLARRFGAFGKGHKEGNLTFGAGAGAVRACGRLVARADGPPQLELFPAIFAFILVQRHLRDLQ